MSVIDSIIEKEGGYCDHPEDRGGPTCYGITLAVARASGYEGDMRDMPVSLAHAIYTKRYVTDPAFDRVGEIDQDIADELIDMGVNMGPAIAATVLQRLLNVLNAQGTKYADLFVDGRIGGITLDGLSKYLAWRGADGKAVMRKAIACLRGARYIDIAERDSTQETFIFGWLRNRVSL